MSCTTLKIPYSKSKSFQGSDANLCHCDYLKTTEAKGDGVSIRPYFVPLHRAFIFSDNKPRVSTLLIL